jgi:phosphopentomutase
MGYAKAHLECLRYAEIWGASWPRLRSDDMMLFTADHGNDPTWTGTDHTRERVPVLGKGPYSGQIGIRGFVDVAASVAAHLGVPSAGPGQSFI